MIGGVYVASRQQSAARALRRRDGCFLAAAMQEEDDYEPAEIALPWCSRRRQTARPTSMLMEGIKEELFQLEVERKQGQISQAEYEKAKSALDQTLERALKARGAESLKRLNVWLFRSVL